MLGSHTQADLREERRAGDHTVLQVIQERRQLPEHSQRTFLPNHCQSLHATGSGHPTEAISICTKASVHLYISLPSCCGFAMSSVRPLLVTESDAEGILNDTSQEPAKTDETDVVKPVPTGESDFSAAAAYRTRSMASDVSSASGVKVKKSFRRLWSIAPQQRERSQTCSPHNRPAACSLKPPGPGSRLHVSDAATHGRWPYTGNGVRLRLGSSTSSC